MAGRVVTKACVLAVGVNEAGRREVLGLAVGPAETEKFWSAFLRDLIGRGLAGVQLAISDAHQGLKQAIARHSDIVRIFPNEDAIRRLVGAAVLEQSDEWRVGRWYMAQHSLASLSEPDEGGPREIERAT